MASGETFRLASSSSETAAQESSSEESVNGEDEVETRPFPKVGDVVRYEGKWEGDVSFGEVRERHDVLLCGIFVDTRFGDCGRDSRPTGKCFLSVGLSSSGIFALSVSR